LPGARAPTNPIIFIFTFFTPPDFLKGYERAKNGFPHYHGCRRPANHGATVKQD
jgi:hypothetical protein